MSYLLTGLAPTFLLGYEALCPKLLNRHLGALREEQHIPVLVSHPELMLFRVSGRVRADS
jgi:hypothetical protein